MGMTFSTCVHEHDKHFRQRRDHSIFVKFRPFALTGKAMHSLNSESVISPLTALSTLLKRTPYKSQEASYRITTTFRISKKWIPSNVMTC